jgi:uncharacterized OB-fold protein
VSATWDPAPDVDLAPFWAGAADGELRAPVCSACARVVLRPRAICPHCHAADLSWRTLSGRGVVYAFGVEQRDVAPDRGLVAPYVVALVDLEEGGRLVTNIVDDPDDVRIGMAVEVVFVELPDGSTVPRFRRR